MKDIVKTAESGKIITQTEQDLKRLSETPSIIGTLEFITGLTATAVSNPSNLILSAGHLAQSLFNGRFYKQLNSEVNKYKDEGKTSEENLDSAYGRNIFVELLKTLDEENLDDKKFQALKSIFLNAINKNANEQTQIQAYQYFQVCKKLNSIDILVLRAAYDLYGQQGEPIPSGGNSSWETLIADTIGVPTELVTQSRLENSGVSATPKTLIFNNEVSIVQHGLTGLGIALAKYIQET